MRTRTLTIATAACALALAPTVVFATEDYVEVSWATPVTSDQPMPGDNVAAIWPQTLANGETCGVWLQQDHYKPGDATDSLIASGVLNGAHEDGSLLDYDYPFASTGKPWQFIKAPDCVEPEPSVTPSAEPSPEPEPVATEAPEPVPSATPEPVPEPTVAIGEPACGPIGSCGEVPTYVTPTPTPTPAPEQSPTEAPAATPVVAEARFAG